MNPLELDRVTYTYPESSRPALDGIDLRIEGGERVLVGGASGSGKSTLLRTANGLVPHFYGGRFAGRVRLQGVDTRTASPQSLAVQAGMVFQDLPARFLTDSVEDEIAFSLELGGSGARLIASRVEAIVERMGVARLVGRRLEHLSSGEQARLAIAAALARQPSLLLLDEPVTHIDPAGAQAVVAWVNQLARQEGVTVLVAEHRVETWRPMLDRQVRLMAGASPGGHAATAAGGEHILPGLHAQMRDIPAQTLRARGLRLALGRRPILQGIDLDLHPGELLALVGRNGSGKTTLLRTLVGLQRPDAGSIDLDERATAGGAATELARTIGFVPQSPMSMLFAETVEEEVLLTLRSRGQEASSSAEPWLEAFGLAAQRRRYPRDLSAGERQRLALAAVLAGRPPLLLLDEPTLGMDRDRLSWLGRVLAALCRAGCAILVATHDAGFVAEHATRAVLLEEGRVAAAGRPEEVLQSDPAFAGALSRWRAEADIIAREGSSQGEAYADG